jgi:hypothetical protein
MEHVIVEGRYPEPTTPEALLERGKTQRFCFDLYRSHPVSHFLSLDGAHICCVFRAPDAESVRSALRSIAVLPPDRVWTASLEGPPAGDMAALHGAAAAVTGREALVLVERDFPEPVSFPDLQEVEERGGWCLELYGIRFLGSFFARDHRRMICLYAAPDAEAVRHTNKRLAMPFERVWPARVVGPDAP